MRLMHYFLFLCLVFVVAHVGAQTSECFGDQEEKFEVFLEPKVNQSVAKKACSDSGGTLARIGDLKEFNRVVDLARGLDAVFHIGIEDFGRPGSGNQTERFTFIDGDTEHLDFIHTGVGEFPWFEGQPDNFNSFCVIINVNLQVFNDIPCNSPLSYICRRACNTPTSSPTEQASSPPSSDPSVSQENQDQAFIAFAGILGFIALVLGIATILLYREKQRIKRMETTLRTLKERYYQQDEGMFLSYD